MVSCTAVSSEGIKVKLSVFAFNWKYEARYGEAHVASSRVPPYFLFFLFLLFLGRRIGT